METKQQRAKIAKLERAVLRHAMQRLKSWKREHPKGQLPWGHPQGMQHKSGWNMVKACLDLEKARAALKESA